MSDQIEITAKLEHIIYQNGEGFIIASFFNENIKTFIGLGNIVNPYKGLEYKLFGTWKTHDKYGRQFAFVSYQTVKPQDTEGIFRYLVRFARWVGPTTASLMVDNFGEETLDVLRKEPETVAKSIKGLSLKKAKEISETLIQLEFEESVMVELMSILTLPGLRKNLPYELVAEYGSNAAEILKENPYIICDFAGTGFILADRLAVQCCKIDPESMFRKKAAVRHVIKEQQHGNGHTWVLDTDVKMEAADLISTKLRLDTAIFELCEDGVLVMDRAGYLTFVKVDEDESLIARKIMGGVKNAIKRKTANSP